MERYLSNRRIYFFDIILDTISRTMPHAILTILFLDKGVTIPQIALIQAFYNLAVILFEFPSGVLSDLYSRKKVYIISNVVMIGGYMLLIFSKGFIFISIIWFIYGISSALSSGTIDADIIVDIKTNGGKLEKFFRASNQISLITSIVSVSLGSLLYYRIGIKMYWISLIILTINVVVTAKYFKKDIHKNNTKGNVSIKKHIKDSFLEIKKVKELRFYIIMFAIIQIFMQTHFQLWQALFLYKNFNKEIFFIFYILFQIIEIVSYTVKIEKMKISYLLYLIIIASILTCIFQMGINNIFFLIIYLIICFIVFIINYYCTVQFNKVVSREKISSLTSLTSTIARLFSFIILIACSYLLNIFNIEKVYLINFIITFILSFVMLVKINRYYSKKEILSFNK